MVYKWLFSEQLCLLCDGRGAQELPLCTACEADLPWLGNQCTVCALPLPTHGLVCGRCQKHPPAYARIEVPWRYAFPVDALVHRFKHQARWPLGRLLALGLARHLGHAFAEGQPRPDVLLPVPLATARLRQRGFNQAEMIARWLAAPLRLPVDTHGLRRIRDTPAQQALDAEARRRNLRDAFALERPEHWRDRHVALVDDVVTTGATVESLARLLHKAGARRVDVYCLARTPRPGD